jgi:hypothetical protein
MISIPAETALPGESITGSAGRPDRLPRQAHCPPGQARLPGQLGQLSRHAVLSHQTLTAGSRQAASAAAILKCMWRMKIREQ